MSDTFHDWDDDLIFHIFGMCVSTTKHIQFWYSEEVHQSCVPQQGRYLFICSDGNGRVGQLAQDWVLWRLCKIIHGHVCVVKRWWLVSWWNSSWISSKRWCLYSPWATGFLPGSLTFFFGKMSVSSSHVDLGCCFYGAFSATWCVGESQRSRWGIAGLTTKTGDTGRRFPTMGAPPSHIFQ